MSPVCKQQIESKSEISYEKPVIVDENPKTPEIKAGKQYSITLNYLIFKLNN